jgi:hypothetical protein
MIHTEEERLMNKFNVLVLVVIATVCGIGCDPYSTPVSDPPFADVAVPDASGCSHEYDGACYDYPIPVETHVVPTPGHYAVRPADPSISVAPLDVFGFDVAASALCINFTVDSFAFYKITVTFGTFSLIHGARGDGTYFPSDGFIVSGSFVTPTEAEGFFQYMPMLVKRTPGNFVATYVP